ncbi:MAG: hypothetical protein ACI9T8_000675 [Candidatus Saccharimonadales bacterium]
MLSLVHGLLPFFGTIKLTNMKIAIDESGDSGRKFWKGSSKWFIVTAVIVPDSKKCGPTCLAVDDYRKTHSAGRELHFTHNSHEQHTRFLQHMHDYEFVYASVCIDKRKLLRKNPRALGSKMALFRFAFDKLFEEITPYLDSPVVLIDTNGPKQFNRSLSRHLIKRFGSGHKNDIHKIEQIRSVDSNKEPLVQLADYVSGTVHHHVDENHHSDTFEQYLSDKGKIVFVY